MQHHSSVYRNRRFRLVQYCTASIALLLLLVPRSSAQEAAAIDYRTPFQYTAQETVYVFTDSANVRSEAGAAAAKTDLVYAGQELKVRKILQEETMNGKQATWCEVSYLKNGAERTGYVWGGLLSLTAVQKDGHLFLYSYRYPAKEEDPVQMDVKVMQNGVVKDRCFYSFPVRESTNAFGSRWLPAKGLSGLKGILVLSFSGEACAIPTYHQYLGWTGSKLVKFPELMSVFDAGVGGMEQEFIFPADKGGKPGILQLKEVTEESDENGNTTSRKVRREHYRWVPGSGKFVK